jgi:uncharacterized protein YecE (DUF72 family)
MDHVLPKRRNGIRIKLQPAWRGPFFPKEVMVEHHLIYYATQFDTDERNGVYYRAPSPEAVRGWHDQTAGTRVLNPRCIN